MPEFDLPELLRAYHFWKAGDYQKSVVINGPHWPLIQGHQWFISYDLNPEADPFFYSECNWFTTQEEAWAYACSPEYVARSQGLDVAAFLDLVASMESAEAEDA